MTIEFWLDGVKVDQVDSFFSIADMEVAVSRPRRSYWWLHKVVHGLTRSRHPIIKVEGNKVILGAHEPFPNFDHASDRYPA
jgi:hypothetical protein